MSPQQQCEAIVQCLNEGFAADPSAMRALLCVRIPCNQAFADHPKIIVEGWPDHVGAVATVLGLLNGVLDAAGIPKVASKWSAPGYEGHRTMLGFEPYRELTVDPRQDKS